MAMTLQLGRSMYVRINKGLQTKNDG
jgi:hypothetical protein